MAFILPRLNPLTKFPLNISPPGHASLNSPHTPVNIQATKASIIGPVKAAPQQPITPVSWATTPYLNKASASQPIANNTGGLRR
jgi:hypothetical protein